VTPSFKHEVLAAVTREGVTVAAVAAALCARHPECSPVWVRNRVLYYLLLYARMGRIERSGAGRDTLYARPLRDS
jgi:hypothetical protein